MDTTTFGFGEVELYQGYPVSLTVQEPISMIQAIEVQRNISEKLDMPVRIFGPVAMTGQSVIYRLLHTYSVIHYMSTRSIESSRSAASGKTPLCDGRKVRVVGLWDGEDVRTLLAVCNQIRDKLSIRDRIVKRHALALQSVRFDERDAASLGLKPADYQGLTYFIDRSGRTIFFPSPDQRFRESALAVYSPDIENALKAIALFKLKPGQKCDGKLPDNPGKVLFSALTSAKGITNAKLGVDYE